MASNYPTSLDNFTNPTSNDSLNSPSHSLQHANINDAVEAIEAKLGIGASTAGSATSGYVLTAGTGGTTTWSPITPAGLSKVTTRTITGSSGEAFTGLSAGSRYRIVFNMYSNTLGSYVLFQFREGSTNKATNYEGGSFYAGFNGATGNLYNASGATYITLVRLVNTLTSSAFMSFDLDIRSNGDAANITGTGFASYDSMGIFLGFRNEAMSACDGFYIYPSTGTFTGTLTLYKYED